MFRRNSIGDGHIDVAVATASCQRHISRLLFRDCYFCRCHFHFFLRIALDAGIPPAFPAAVLLRKPVPSKVIDG